MRTGRSPGQISIVTGVVTETVAAPTIVLGATTMIDPTRTPVPAPIDGRELPGEADDRDELSMRLVEWALALVALGAAVVLALR